MDDRYKKLEGLLYSYKELSYKKRNCEIDLKLEDNPKKQQELKRIELTIEKIDNILEMVKDVNAFDYLIIKLRYIEGLSWVEISDQLNMSHDHIIKRRRKLFEEKLLSMV
nr:hypothetical protein [uncultured Cellulosilyticum sp.]